ncbi:alpha/beta hydrolase [Enterococcus xiangfangensis]|uniref:alpha/beta hydrolase n=1 Tax=Enterococcus xiangfangensis TaxID=1296537 RepID=UPI0010F4D333|nr:alpha/beta hydrolase [Enterococcus xiangfangensis]MBM7711435.1 putative alpha/beta hydrolase family protein [Enterococcus xiangfangensis]NBK09288.1 alpha/beta hydrolase [Enterococcus asini]
MQRIVKGIILLIGFLLVSGGIYYAKIRYFSPGTLVKQKTIHYSNVPTVFIHGYEGSSFSFGPLLRNLEKENIAKRELTIVVEADGTLDVEGKLENNKDNPTIMVLFAKDVTSEITQSKWIDHVMRYLFRQKITQVNLVSHSMGGVSSLRYLLEYAGEKTPAVEHFVAIAAPFNDLEIAEDTEEIFAYELTEEGPEGKTPIYQYFDQAMTHLPQRLQVLNVAGDLKDDSNSDGSVSIHSVFALRFLLQRHAESYRELTVTGKSGGHSRITKSIEFEKELIRFIWKKTA